MLDKRLQQKNHPIIIFYERHSDKMPAHIMRQLLPYLKAQNIQIYGSEEPHDETPDYFITALQAISQQYKLVLNHLPSFQESLAYQRQVSHNNMLTPDDFRKGLTSMISSNDETIALVQTVIAQGLIYVGLDLNRKYREQLGHNYSANEINDFRDKHMVIKVAESCLCYNSGIALLVGLNHLKMESMLREQGFNVLSFYIASQEPVYARDSQNTISDADIRVRNHDQEFAKKYQHSINVIDVYGYPNIDPVATAEALLNEFFTKSKRSHHAVATTSLSCVHDNFLHYDYRKALIVGVLAVACAMVLFTELCQKRDYCSERMI